MTQWAELPKNFGTIKLSSPEHQPACGCIDCMIAHAAAKETSMPKMTQTEQHQLRETTLNEIGLALARIEDQQHVQREGLAFLIKYAQDPSNIDGLSAKLDTLSGQLGALDKARDSNVHNFERLHGLLERRIDKLGNDLRNELKKVKKKKKHG